MLVRMFVVASVMVVFMMAMMMVMMMMMMMMMMVMMMLLLFLRFIFFLLLHLLVVVIIIFAVIIVAVIIMVSVLVIASSASGAIGYILKNFDRIYSPVRFRKSGRVVLDKVLAGAASSRAHRVQGKQGPSPISYDRLVRIRRRAKAFNS